MNREIKLLLALCVGVWFGAVSVLTWAKFSTPSDSQQISRFY